MSKKQTIQIMFNDIADHYDLLNSVLSLRVDKVWRKKFIRQIAKDKPECLLDVACGTGDIAIRAQKKLQNNVTGVDNAPEMLKVGEKKLKKKSLETKIKLFEADAENLPFEDNCFDAVSIAFGIRNSENTDKELSELLRVLKPNKSVYILELGNRKSGMYDFYFKRVMPRIAGKISKNIDAYKYLYSSTKSFPCGNDFTDLLEKNNFKNINSRSLNNGIAYIYTANK